MSTEEKLADALATLQALLAVTETSGMELSAKYFAMSAIVRKATK